MSIEGKEESIMTQEQVSDKVNIDELKEQNIESLAIESIKLREEIEVLIKHINKRQRECIDMESENRYLQEYVGSLMSSGKL